MLVKVKEVKVGNGVVRFDIEPSCAREQMPSSVVEDIMRDVVKQKNSRWTSSTATPKFTNPISTCGCGMREPDGIDIHVDKPLKKNFRYHSQWVDAMAKYRTLERVAKDCDWECREPMATIPNYRRVEEKPCEDLDLLFVADCWYI